MSNVSIRMLGVRLAVFDEFIASCGGEKALHGKTTSEVNERYIMPQVAKVKTSYCDFLMTRNHWGVDIATVYISHSWESLFLDLVEAMKCYFSENPDVVVWIDMFSSNQFIRNNSQQDSDWVQWNITFKSAIEEFGHTVVVITSWDNPTPLRRTWCLFEIYCTIEMESKLEIAMTFRYDIHQ